MNQIERDRIRADIRRDRKLCLLSALGAYGGVALAFTLIGYLGPDSRVSLYVGAVMFIGSAFWGYLFVLPWAFYARSKGNNVPPFEFSGTHIKFHVMRFFVAPIFLTIDIAWAVKEPKRCRSCLAQNPRKYTDCAECSGPI